MRTRYFVGGLLAAALMSSTALAQTTTPSTTTPAATPAPTNTVVQGKNWRSSKLIGVNIYNDQNEKLGDISEIILDPQGKVLGYVVGIGGFLGMGQHDILVEPSQIRFVDEPVRTSSTTTTTTTTATPSGTPMTTRNVSASDNTSTTRWYPDHGVMSASKDQLKAMPAFKY